MSALIVEIDLTDWRESYPPGLTLRDWRPSADLPQSTPCGEPGLMDRALHGAAAVVRDESPLPGAIGDRRWSWRVWTPIGTVWPWRAGTAPTRAAAMMVADAHLSELAMTLGGPR